MLTILLYAIIVFAVLYVSAGLGAAMDLSVDDEGVLDFTLLMSQFEAVLTSTDTIWEHFTDFSGYSAKITLIVAFALGIYALLKANLTLYAVWSEKKPTAKITLHFDDKVQIVEKEIGSTVDMLDSFGVFKDGYAVEGWYLENSPERLESLYLSEDCDVYAKWQTAKYITITIDRSYLNKKAEAFKVPCDMTGTATLKLPTVDDKGDIYNSVFGCTYGFSDKKQTGEFGTIKYFGGTE